MRAKSKEAAISQCDVLHITRSQVKKPNQPLFSNKMSEHYTAEDLYIGAQVEFNCFVFKIVDAGKNRGRTIGLQLQQADRQTNRRIDGEADKRTETDRQKNGGTDEAQADKLAERQDRQLSGQVA